MGNTYSPPLGYDPYAVYQQPGAPVVPGPPLPPSQTPIIPSQTTVIPQTTVIQQPLPVYPATYPVRFVLSGEFLYLRPSDASMTNYAVPVNGGVIPPPTPPVPMGAVAATELGFDPGFRVGLDWVWNDYSRWVLTYTQLDSKDSSEIMTDPATSPLVLQSLVMHPSTAAADAYYLTASATGELDLKLVDFDYRRIFVEDWYRWDFLAGMRYAHLDQTFNSIFQNSTTTEEVNSSVGFDGGGIRIGTRGDWRSPNHGFFVYGQATTGFLAGRFSSAYSQSDNLLGTIANTSRKDDRIINVTDAELGVGWHSPGQRWWFSGGYLFSTWSDVVNNAGVIRAAQATSFGPIRERLTFDGLAARGEFRF